MPRPLKGPRLELRTTHQGRSKIWFVRDGETRRSTGCSEDDLRGAEKALAAYIAAKWEPPGTLPLAELFIDEVVACYLKETAAHSLSREFLTFTARPIVEWWSGKTLADLNDRNCKAYATWRTSQPNKLTGEPIREQTAYHDLKTLRTAVNYYRERERLPFVPKVWLPERAPQRKDYWLTRKQVAARVRCAWRNRRWRQVVRMLLIGVYTGTRPGAILKLKWVPSTTDGWIDLESGILHRVGIKAKRSKKRQPEARIHRRLLPHLRRWRKADLALGITSVVHFQGKPVGKLRRSWDAVARAAGHEDNDGPHICRHTAATWQMQSGTDLYDAAHYLGMTPETLWTTYGHHHPDFQESAASADGRRRERTPV